MAVNQPLTLLADAILPLRDTDYVYVVQAATTTGSRRVLYSNFLNDTGVSAGTYGDSTHVPQVAVNAKGRITAASNVAISGGGSPIQTITVTLTDTQIKAMFAVPITVIAAPGAKKVIQPLAMHILTSFAAGAYAQNNSVNLYWNGVNPAILANVTGYMNTTAVEYATANMTSQALASANSANQPLTVSNTTSAFTGGNAANTLKLILEYVVLDFN